MAGARATPTRTPQRPSSPAPRTEAVVPPDWASAVTHVSSHSTPPPVVVVCGPKNSGKYGKVGYLDTDVGQPEFAPPGCLSFHVVDGAISDLLNPTLREAERCEVSALIYVFGNLSLLNAHVFLFINSTRCCFFGDISSKRDPEAYLNCLFHLYDYFVGKYRCDENEMLPLIVNTPGWVKGAGFDMLVEMLRYICPTIVVQIRITMQSKNLPDGMFWLDDNAVVRFVFSTVGESAGHQLGNSLPSFTAKTSSVRIASSFGGGTQDWLQLRMQFFSEIYVEFTQIIMVLCSFAGIVRGIDVQKGLLYVITPVPLKRLQSVDLLQQGLIEIPTTLLQVRGCVSPYMSTNVLHKISERDLYAGEG
ncbi:Polynucleotide 5'-hydroxyl-kinase NOL9 [Dichanthelium oligosanthes]|uniref:Polynucleotide 5'-hydroxyl-kinase NOL9 n=1 Tax=Dichanthelium oligosanthes TaxID=888268 RepID=A0A1E5W960_9POAL|nr:Polynucleotide 5'-hydroxyl-kinase NOL9 [Dichanthelium oligosanthes]